MKKQILALIMPALFLSVAKAEEVAITRLSMSEGKWVQALPTYQGVVNDMKGDLLVFPTIEVQNKDGQAITLKNVILLDSGDSANGAVLWVATDKLQGLPLSSGTTFAPTGTQIEIGSLIITPVDIATVLAKTPQQPGYVAKLKASVIYPGGIEESANFGSSQP